MSVEELNQQQKSTKHIVGFWIGLLLVMAVARGILTFQKGFTVFTVLPIFFLPLALTSFDKLKKIQAELRLRN